MAKGFYSKYSEGRPPSPRQVYKKKSNRRPYRKKSKGLLGFLLGR